MEQFICYLLTVVGCSGSCSAWTHVCHVRETATWRHHLIQATEGKRVHSSFTLQRTLTMTSLRSLMVKRSSGNIIISSVIIFTAKEILVRIQARAYNFFSPTFFFFPLTTSTFFFLFFFTYHIYLRYFLFHTILLFSIQFYGSIPNYFLL